MDKETKNTITVFDSLADLYQTKYQDIAAYHQGLDVFCSNLKRNSKVLELACGPGNVTQYLIEQQPSIHILCTDLAPNMLQLAQKTNPSATIKQLDCRQIDTLTDTFDGIVMAFGLPYLNKKESLRFIEQAYLKLNNKGVLYISFIEGINSDSGYKKGSTGDTIFMNFHEAKYLITKMKDIGFKTLHEKQILSNNTGDTEFEIVAQKKT